MRSGCRPMDSDRSCLDKLLAASPSTHDEKSDHGFATHFPVSLNTSFAPHPGRMWRDPPQGPGTILLAQLPTKPAAWALHGLE